jgi:hypothetical protein
MTAAVRNFSLFCGCMVLLWMCSCSSSKSAPVQQGLQFTTPRSAPTVEIATPTQSFSVSVNQNVTWTLQSGCGFGKPIGTLSNTTATSATYTAPAAGSSVSQPCSPNFQDAIVATTSSSQSAVLSVTIVAGGPAITNVSANTFTAPLALCSANGNPCCPQGSLTCCPPAAGTTIIELGSFAGSDGITQVGAFTNIGPIQVSNTGSVGGAVLVPPYTWQIASGSLPAGLTLTPGTDTTQMFITGAAITPGCSTFALQVTDGAGVASTTGPFTFNLVTIPQGLKLAVPSYAAAYNNEAQAGDPGLPYAPIALTASGGTAPYAWTEDPGNAGFTLPPGLVLVPSTSNTVLIQGTPTSGDDIAFNLPGASAGLYPSKILVSDSESPYPAVALANLSNMTGLADAQPCSQTNQAIPIPPLGVSINGGLGSANSVAAESYLQGSLAFMLHGFDANGPVLIAGSVGVDGQGNLTGGEEDVMRSGGSQHLAIQPSSSNPASYYVVGTTYRGPGAPGSVFSSYSRGCMTLATSAGSSTFAFTLSGCSNHWNENHLTTTNDNACGMAQDSQGNNIAAGYFTAGRIVEFDACTAGSAPYCTGSTRASGIMRWQDSSNLSAGLSGAYAFGVSGWDSTAKHYAIAGSFQARSANISSLAADIDDAGNLSSQVTGGSGSYGSVDSFGNATGSLTIGQTTLPISLYVVSRNEAVIVTNPGNTGAPMISGEAISTGTSFSNASLQNAEMFHIGGVSPTGPDVSIGVLAFDGAGSVSGTAYQDQAGTIATTSLSGVYQVDPNTGRVAFTAPQQGQTLGAHGFVGYMIPLPANWTRQNCSTPANCVAGFLVGTDSTAQDGILEFQTPLTAPPPPFTNLFIAGDYAFGTDELLDIHSPAFEGVVYAQPSGASTTTGSFAPNTEAEKQFVRDVSYSCDAQAPQPDCLLLPSQSLTGSYSISSNGTGSFGGETVSVSNGNETFFIEESPVNLYPSVVVAEQ